MKMRRHGLYKRTSVYPKTICSTGEFKKPHGQEAKEKAKNWKIHMELKQ